VAILVRGDERGGVAPLEQEAGDRLVAVLVDVRGVKSSYGGCPIPTDWSVRKPRV
jgi:hypothetical protein